MAHRSSRFLSVFSLLACVLICPRSRVSAHAPAQVAQFVSSSPDNVILATNRGLVLGNLNTRSWSLLCNEAIGVHGVSTSSSYHVVTLASGRWLAATVDGLSFSDDRGCSWQDLPALPGLSTPALVQHPSDPSRLYAATYDKGQGTVRVSTDAGESFQTLFETPAGQYPSSLLLAATEPVTLYVATIGLGDDKKLQLHVSSSSDGGATWQSSLVPRTDTENGIYLLAVNPARPTELFARAAADEPSLGERLLWSQDGGKTFTSPLTMRELQTAAFSRDGKVAYAGGVDGLWRADDAARTFVQLPMTARIACVEERAGELLAAGYYEGLDAMRDGVGVWMDGAFQRWMDLDEVTDQANCPAPSTAQAKCDQLWQDWLLENPPPPSTTDAGVFDASSDAGPPAKAAPHSGGCALGAHVQGAPPCIALLAALALTFLLRRRGCA